MRWHRGENLAGLVGECLQTLGEALPPPFAAFRQHFPFEVGQRGQTLQVFQVFFHDSRVVPFLPVRNRYALDIKNSVKTHPRAALAKWVLAVFGALPTVDETESVRSGQSNL